MVDIYFKLFNSIKDSHEVELARLEIESFIGKVETISNFVDELTQLPLGSLLDSTQLHKQQNESDEVRFQDYLTHELPYGKIQGFAKRNIENNDIDQLICRLGYTREIYLVSDDISWDVLLHQFAPTVRIGLNCNVFEAPDSTVAIRIITNQYFLERSEYIVRVTRSLSLDRIPWFVNRMFENLMRHIYRIPASAKARIGKRLLDYMAERVEQSQYLSHGLHPYKGKFHPKMVRALINIIFPQRTGYIMDNFSGSGTLMVEASLMGLDSIGIDVNPLSVLIAKGKCDLLHVSPALLEEKICGFMSLLEKEIDKHDLYKDGQSLLESNEFAVPQSELNRIRNISRDVFDDFMVDNALVKVLIAQEIIERTLDGDIKDIFRLGLAITISDLKGKPRKPFLDRMKIVMDDIYRRASLLNHLKQILHLPLGRGVSLVGDASDLVSEMNFPSIGGNVNSPPYSTAIDYVKNDISQLLLLGLVQSSDDLGCIEQKIGGNPHAKYNYDEIRNKVSTNPDLLPEYAIWLVRLLMHHGRKDRAARLYHFFKLIKQSLVEQFQVLQPGGMIATIIGNNHFKLANIAEFGDTKLVDHSISQIPIEIQHMKNCVRSLDITPILGPKVLQKYGAHLPVKISINGGGNSSQSGVYVEVENERLVVLIGRSVGFEPFLTLNRYLEKTLRGNIRYETIVILRKP